MERTVSNLALPVSPCVSISPGLNTEAEAAVPQAHTRGGAHVGRVKEHSLYKFRIRRRGRVFESREPVLDRGHPIVYLVYALVESI